MKELRLLYIFLIWFLLSVAVSPTWAQTPSEKQDYGFEMGAHLGKLLPNQIGGVTEIVPQWGFRTGWATGSHSAMEVGAIMGKGEGADWTNASVSLRMDIPIETLTGIALIGIDVTHYQGVNTPKKTFGGGHIGGGIMALIADELWFRSDMKFNVNPGTSLYFGFGFLLRFAGGDSKTP